MWAATHVELLFACCAGCLYAGPLRARAGVNEARPRENEARPLASVAARRRCCLCAVRGAPRASRPGSLLCVRLRYGSGCVLCCCRERMSAGPRYGPSLDESRVAQRVTSVQLKHYRSHVHALFHRHDITPHNHIKIIDCDFTTMIIMCRLP